MAVYRTCLDYGPLSVRAATGNPTVVGQDSRLTAARMREDAEETAHSVWAYPSSAAPTLLALAPTIPHGPRRTPTNLRRTSCQPSRMHKLVWETCALPSSTWPCPSARDDFSPPRPVGWPLCKVQTPTPQWSHGRGTRLQPALSLEGLSTETAEGRPKSTSVPRCPCLTMSCKTYLPFPGEALVSRSEPQALLRPLLELSSAHAVFEVVVLIMQWFTATSFVCTLLSAFQGPLVLSSRNGRYGCMTPQRPHCDSTGNVDNEARKVAGTVVSRIRAVHECPSPGYTASWSFHAKTKKQSQSPPYHFSAHSSPPRYLDIHDFTLSLDSTTLALA
ncbi:predicted protein [Plenodomus lingam JN3]|uniref:Predicted protein n=1 Tax=Leptosphaeria maculans (strain JN3 / isolate v23.1.3 / race Av1-4-5-6-7-8) TaxID=985895 RepID=E4ZLS4_LEPMJ|nr:predicted protein [Plenodomus lingam JN3]CBX92754.1 predicted protein [Plenodomus lingam JN3]